MRKGRCYDIYDPKEFTEEELKSVSDDRSDVLSRGVLIQCEFCDNHVWLDDKEWEIVTCEDKNCVDKAIRRYCV